MGALKSSIQLMHLMHEKNSSASINAAFDGDTQLVSMLWSYLLHNHCIERNSVDKSGWVVSSKGEKWIQDYSEG